MSDIMDTNSQRDAMESDVKHKISKLEADSRQLCENLRNLHKNRVKLTNEAVALTQELKSPALRSDFPEEAIRSDSNCIHVLLDAKHVQNDCCTICTCSECEDYSEVTGDILEKDLDESLMKAISAEERNEHKCCCVCYTNKTTVSTLSEKSATIVDSGVGNDLNSSGSQEKVTFCSACSVEGQYCNNRCEICECELDCHKISWKKNEILRNSLRTETQMEERCRGGMDYVEHKFRTHSPCEKDRKKRVCEGCECNLCAISNVEGQQPPCMMCNSFETFSYANDDNAIDELLISSGDAPAKLQEICKVEKLREVLEQLKNRNHALRKMLSDCECLNQSHVNSLAPETDFTGSHADFPETDNLIGRSTNDLIATVKHLQTKCRTKDGMILALAEAFKKLASPDQTNRILKKLTNPCTDDSPIRDLDRSGLWQLLRMENQTPKQREEKKLENEGQDENEEENRSEESSKCRCATYTEVLPPRNLRIVERTGTDTLVISWEPPESGPVNGYKVFVDERLAAHLQTPLRKTEAVLHDLDLTIPRLIEILAIGSTGLGSSTIEKLYDPVRFDRSKAR